MATNELIETDLAIECGRCGRDCGDGYQERIFESDPETGYKDTEIVCSRCLREAGEMIDASYEELSDEEIGYAEADLKGDMERDGD